THLLTAWKNCGYEAMEKLFVVSSTITGRDWLTEFEVVDVYLWKAKASLKYLVDEGGKIVLVWEYILESKNGKDNWLVYIDSFTGEVLRKQNRVLTCRFHPSEKTETTGIANFFRPSMDPLYQYRVFPLKVESPEHGNRTLEISPADEIASPYNWHDTNGVPGPEHTTTKGNKIGRASCREREEISVDGETQRKKRGM